MTISIQNIPAPTNGGDAVNKTYADALPGKAYPNQLHGLLPERATASTSVTFYNGAIANGQTNPDSMLDLGVTSVTVDLTTNGALGLDTGSLAANDSIQFYMIGANSGSGVTIVGSKSITYGGVTIPSGYTSAKMSKIPFAAIYHTTYGIPDFRLQGWPSMTPTILLSDWDKSNWKALSAGASTTYANVDLFTGGTRWLPDASRLAKIMYQFKSTTGSGDLCFKIAGSSYEQLVATVGVGGTVTGFYDVVTSSAGIFQYKVPANCTVDLYVLGYTMSEA